MNRGYVVVAAAFLLGGCDGENKWQPDIRTTLMQAAEKTLDAGPSRVTATVGRYRIRGRFDPANGYRLCGAVSAPQRDFAHGRSLWLERRAGSYETLTTLRVGSPHCRRAAVWLDDHPPTLDIGAEAGGEDLLHATLIALTALPWGPSSGERACGSGCLRATLDFPALDRKPGRRDEDRWTLVPLLRSLDRHPITAQIDEGGYLSRIELADTSVTLSDYGEARPVPRIVARAIE